MRKLYRSWNSLYLQNLLSFLADVQKLRCFLKKKKNSSALWFLHLFSHLR